MATSPHEGLFRRPSREKIVAAVGGGIPKSQAARAFGVSLSSVKRYVKKADRGEPPAPRKSPGSAPKPDEKATKLLEADLKQRASATLREERRDYLHALITGLSVSRSTICRAVARIGSSRKKGADPRRSATSSEEPPGG
jgi:transposase